MGVAEESGRENGTLDVHKSLRSQCRMVILPATKKPQKNEKKEQNFHKAHLNINHSFTHILTAVCYLQSFLGVLADGSTDLPAGHPIGGMLP